MRQSRAIEGETRNATVPLDACENWPVALMCAVVIEPARLPDRALLATTWVSPRA